MSQLTLVSNYSTDDRQRELLYPLFEKAFGIPADTFQDFYGRGFWNPTYTPYSLFEGDMAVANVSVFSLPLTVNGKPLKAAGIQSVMTHPEYRGRGLMKQLFAKALEDIDQQFEAAFLYTSSPELYTSFGFRTLQQHYFVAPMNHVPTAETRPLRKLDFFNEEELQIVRDLFTRNTRVSQQFATTQYAPSFYLNLYNPFFHEKLYYSEDLQAVLLFQVKEGTLRLFDVLAEKMPTLEQIAAHVAEPFSRVEVYFCPDLFEGHDFEPVPVQGGDSLMVRGDFELEGEPFTLQPTAAF